IRNGLPILASATTPSMLVAPTPTSIRKQDANFPPYFSSLTVLKTSTRTTRTASTCIWIASQFLTKQWQVGVVGYWYNQVSCDRGSGNRLGCFESRVVGVGPQIGYVFPISKEWQGYLNLKGYGEFASQNRPDGWNAWLTFAISPAAPGEAPPSA